MDWEPGAAYRIQYVSRSGRKSIRTIEVREIRLRNGILYLRSWCRLRGEERTFRADRVLSAETVADPVDAVPPASPAPREKPNRPGSAAEFLGNAFAVFMTLVFVLALAGKVGPFMLDLSSYLPAARPPLASVPAPKPLPPPKPALQETVLAGRVLRTVRANGLERFEVPSLGIVTFHKAEAIAAIRVPNFRAATGLSDRALEARYLAADLNRSGRLAFEELQAFQEKTWREFRYESNEPALRPDEFLAAGCGDCEDFALYTAGLLRFWGWEPYLGILAASRHGSNGHAVCLSYEEGSFPASYT